MTKLSQERITELFLGKQTELLRFLARRLPDEDVARDLAQEAFVRLIRFDRGGQIESPEAYLFRIAANLISEYWRRQRTRMVAVDENDDLENVPGFQESLDKVLEIQQTIEALEQALKNLPEVQRQVLVLHRRDGLTYDEIGAQLGISRDMVKKHLTRALVRCREYLKLTQVW